MVLALVSEVADPAGRRRDLLGYADSRPRKRQKTKDQGQKLPTIEVEVFEEVPK